MTSPLARRVEFTVSSESGKYGVVALPLIVRKQLLDEEGDEDRRECPRCGIHPGGTAVAIL